MKNNISLTLVRFYRKSAKFDLNLSTDLIEILLGLMLGDLYAEKIKPNSNTRLQFKQSIKNKVYIEHLYSIFKDYCKSNPKVNYSIDNRLGKKELNVSIKFWTQSLPCFNQFRELFYDDSGKKFIPLNLEEIITARSLAFWAMDDGYKSANGFYFCTESYTLEDNHKLSKILKNRFNLECGVHKHTNGHRLYVFSSSRDKLLDLVKPYLIDHFYYKFDIN
ncbi:LAGLIDADG homing endonuclease type 2 [Rhizopogon vinicolor AM-OR11-026]|uniref:LAGLIDADG homing endonuclease type 2 n=1 Tax=Rhizopogon vinicolor AM-OR11-026 TaxID=1314800 RepID=A0A1B7MT34_9AGAM|nr:LAGLIDADG homing endonuclease type 2 [Rhizopogon vinicolor AM-OR11-026]